MASAIGVSNSGTVFFSGVASSIDTQSLITNAVNARLMVKKRYTDQISVNTNKISAFTNLNSKASSLKTALDNLSKSTTGTVLNPFSSTQVTYATSNGSNANSILSATTVMGAQAGSYDVVVSKLAKAMSVSSDVQSSATTGLGYNGSFKIGEDGKTAATINVTATTTLTDIRNQINNTTAISGVKADILQQANGQYKLILTGADTAKNIEVTGVTGDDVLTNLGMTNAGGQFTNVIQPAQQAEFTFNGTPITSDTNVVNNVLTGLNLNLTSAAPGTTVTLTVGNNVKGVADQIKTVVDAYNALQNVISANRKVAADGSVDANAYLFGETTNSSLGTALSRMVAGIYGSGGQFNGLRALGITLDGSNNLVIDSTALNAALESNFEAVKNVFVSTDTTTGFADALKAQVEIYSSASSGLIKSEIAALQSTDLRLQQKADAVQSAADLYQQQLIEMYAKMETKIKSADILKQQINAILTGSTPVK